MGVRAIPVGFHSVTPGLIVKGAEQAIDFYVKAFAAREIMRLPMGDRIGHAEIRIGDTIVMLADEFPDMNLLAPVPGSATSVTLMIYLEDVDEAFARAVHAGAKVERPLQDEFYGDRTGTVLDPFGHRWTLSTHIRDVDEAEMKRLMAEMSA